MRVDSTGASGSADASVIAASSADDQTARTKSRKRQRAGAGAGGAGVTGDRGAGGGRGDGAGSQSDGGEVNHQVAVLLERLSQGKGTLSDRLNPTHPCFDDTLKVQWKKLPKKGRKAIVDAGAARLHALVQAVAQVNTTARVHTHALNQALTHTHAHTHTHTRTHV